MTINTSNNDDQELKLALFIRAACVQAAKEAYESASMSGLCCEGSWEAAIGAIEMLDIRKLVLETSDEQD